MKINGVEYDIKEYETNRRKDIKRVGIPITLINQKTDEQFKFVSAFKASLFLRKHAGYIGQKIRDGKKVAISATKEKYNIIIGE